MPASGDYTNTWATPVNADWMDIDNALGGSATINVVGLSGSYTFVLAQYQPPNIIFSGVLTANINYQLPSGVGGVWTVYNNTTGSFTVTMSSLGAGTSALLTQGFRTMLVSDGTNVSVAVSAPGGAGPTGPTGPAGSTGPTGPAGGGGGGGVTSWSGGTTGLSPSTATAGTVTLAGVLNVANGGTGGTTGNLQFGAVGVGVAGSGTPGEIRATNNVTAFYSSDRRWKENIKPIDNALDKVCAIGGKTFDWTSEYIDDHGGEDGYFVRREDFGCVAQDVEAVFPVAVRTGYDGTLKLDYEKLCALAFEAIVELRDEVARLRLRMDNGV